jgi:hypothetical protein
MNTTTQTDYRQQAIDFANKHGVKLHIGDKEYKHYFDDDKDTRFVFKCRLSRKGKSYSFTFGQSINNGDKEPELYDVLACLQKYDPGTFENFCSDFGYNSDSRKSEKIYKAVCKEWKGVERLFSDILDELQEIN